MELLQGTLDLLVLQALNRGQALHGYAVSGWIHDRSGDALLVEEGALYPALHRLERRRLVQAEWGLSENNRRARYYKLTARGKKQLESETQSWKRYAEAVFRVLAAP